MLSIQLWTLSPQVLLAGRCRRQHRRQQLGQVEHRAGEDDGDDAGLVDLERDVGALAAVLLAAHDAFGELDGDASLALLDEHDGHEQQMNKKMTPMRPAGRRRCGPALPGSAASSRPKRRSGSTCRCRCPCSVMSSPIHMSSAVPAVRVSTTRATRAAVKLGSRSSVVPPPPSAAEAAATVVEQERERRRLKQRDADGQIPGGSG